MTSMLASAQADPFGLRMAGENTLVASPGNEYLYNGKELQDELGLGWYDYGARMYAPDEGRWKVVDALGEKYTAWSPYNYVMGNPVRLIDPDGRYATSPDNYVFDQDGNFLRIDENNQPDRIVIENTNTCSVSCRYEFNDPIEDTKAIREGVKEGYVNPLVFISQEEIDQQMIDNGTATTTENPITYIERESRPPFENGGGGREPNSSLLSGKSSGKLDHVSTSSLMTGEMYVVSGNSIEADGKAYNRADFGNFLWGRSGKELGIPYAGIVLGSQLNNLFNGRRDNPGLKWRPLDTRADQQAIRDGYNYPVPSGKISNNSNPNPPKIPGNVTIMPKY